jgi:microcystin degradation protein MlrC
MTHSILLAEIMHETNTFNRIATTRADFDARYWLEGDEIPGHLTNTNTEICGALATAAERGWHVTHPLAASASPSGPLAARDWHRVCELITAPLRTTHFDAIILVLHGSMVTQTTLDAEGDLLSAARALAGPDTLIAVTLDMHANVSRAMADATNLMMAYRTYPHVDQAERGRHIVERLDDVFSRNLKPTVHLVRRPMMDAANHGQTTPGQPMLGLLSKAAEQEAQPGILCASIQIGFPWSDVPDIGPSVAITGTDPHICRTAAESLMEAVWQSRHETQLHFTLPDDAMAAAKTEPKGQGPLVLADFADNPAGGAYGDSPNLLRAMLDTGLSNAAFATISDPETVSQAIAAGEGAELQVRLGGRGAPELTPPLETAARVLRLCDGDFICAGPMWQGVRFSMGPSAVLGIAGIEAIVSSVPTSVMDLNVFRSMGIEPAQKTTLAVKSRNHFKAAYGPIARDTMLVDAGGIASMRLHELTYENIPRPIWPLDDLD